MNSYRERLFAASEVLEAGAWRAELRNDEIADISYRGVPVLRGIRAVVRDQDWQTLAPVVRGIERIPATEGTSLLLDLEFDGFGCRYSGTLGIAFSADSLEVIFDGESPADFQSNRIGLVVLHRPDDAGREVLIGGNAGGQTPSRFPVDISPHQPFREIASMSWRRDVVDFNLSFTGDVFETEDQRNWTDASFKTYSRPLALPFPMDIPAGSRLHQSVRLTASTGDSPTPETTGVEDLVITPEVASVVPALSLPIVFISDVQSENKTLEGAESLLVELVAGAPGLAELAKHASELAESLHLPLDVRLSTETPDEVAAILKLVPTRNIARLGVFHSTRHITEPDLWDGLKSAADDAGLTASLVAGARSHFTELNRNAHMVPADAEALVYSITPQMHATEIPHLVESLPMQRLTARNALRISGGRPLHVGPVTLKPRFNAVSTTTATDETPDEAPTDSLQTDEFAAAWVLGSIAALSIPGVQSLSYFEVAGPRGISSPTGLTPAGRILNSIAALRGRSIFKTRGSRRGLVLYPVQSEDGIEIYAANLTAERMTETVQLPDGNTKNLVLEPWTATHQHTPAERRSS
ncbi:hypothetical protein QF015_000604 [Paenarthrobacter sp. TE4293]|uniref:hypothetical protein n=1 Tax=Paenarthrobacter sp. TE4293 TaxID=3381695 RepID=UPI003D19B5FE